MSFPTDPRDVAAELFVAGGWVDITPDVYLRDGIRITRGRANEASAVSPSTCAMTINNRSGRYSPRNPTGPYFGSVGRNTPLRLAVRTERDTFTRTVSSGWGSADTGGAWTSVGAGSSAPADFNVSSGVGTQSVAVTAAYRISYLAGSLYRDVDVSATVTLPFASVLGGPVEPVTLVVSGLSTSDYFMAQTGISTAGAVSVQIVHVDGTVVAPYATVSGLTFTGQALRARMQVEGQTMRVKLWDASLSEPYAWTVEGRTDRLAGRAAGWVGVRSGVAAGNTNPLPIVFSYDNVEARSCRFAGEVSAWPQQWDLSGADVYTPIEAAGPLRRLGQGASPLKSTLLRGNTTMSPAPVAYWPVEEGSAATSIASGIGGAPMVVDGAPQFAANSDFVGSAPIAKLNGSAWVGDIAGAPATGTIQCTFLLSVPSSGEAAESAIFRINTSGTAQFWDLFYTAGGDLRFKAYDKTRATVMDALINGTLNGSFRQYSLELVQSGSNINWSVVSLVPGASGGGALSGTLAGYTVGAVTGVMASPYHQLTGSAIGHIMVRTYYASLFNLGDQLKAYSGETAAGRMIRLCNENNIPFNYIWDGTNRSALMSPQRRDTVPNLIGECVDADMGSLYERRSSTGLGYRLRSGHYNQPAALALDYSAGHISPPFQPVDDDQALRNDVTVTRTNGTSYEATQTTGPLAVTDSSAGGVGRYDTAVTLNVATDAQVPDAASWLLHLGTVDEARYPTIKVSLAKLAAKFGRAMDLSALSVSVDDRITIANPKTGMDPAQISQLARGYTEVIDAYVHDLTFNCAPERPYEVLQLDAAALGKLDSDTSTLAAGVGSADTTLFVADSTGTGWTTDPAEMPIPITVGGEAMTVTGVHAIAPTYVAAGVASEGSNAPRTPALPAGVVAGDLLLVLAAIRNSGTGTPIAPPGYTLLVFASNMCLFGKIHTGSETAPTVTFAGGVVGATCHAQMAAFRGCSPAVLAANAVLNASAQDIAYPAIPVTTGRAVVLYLGWKQDAFTSVAPVAGAAEIGEVSTITGSGAGIVWDYVIQTTAVNIAAGSLVVTGGVAAISRGAVVALNGNAQAVTVTRSVNGVVKPQAVGASVRTTRPATIAL